MYVRFFAFVELFSVLHLVCFCIARAQKMGNSDRTFEVFEVGSLMRCHESIYLGTSVDVFDARERENDAREDG